MTQSDGAITFSDLSSRKAISFMFVVNIYGRKNLKSKTFTHLDRAPTWTGLLAIACLVEANGSRLHALLICKRGPPSLPTKRAFHHFQTMLIAPIVSPLSLNRRKAKFYNSRLGICQFRSKATEVGGERLQPHS